MSIASNPGTVIGPDWHGNILCESALSSAYCWNIGSLEHANGHLSHSSQAWSLDSSQIMQLVLVFPESSQPWSQSPRLCNVLHRLVCCLWFFVLAGFDYRSWYQKCQKYWTLFPANIVTDKTTAIQQRRLGWRVQFPPCLSNPCGCLITTYREDSLWICSSFYPTHTNRRL